MVILLDNFGAHVTPEVLRLLRDNHIHVVGLAPHSSELCQPLDLCINSPLKRNLAAAWNAKARPANGVPGGRIQSARVAQTVGLPGRG